MDQKVTRMRLSILNSDNKMLTIYQLVQDLATISSYGRPTEFLHKTRILHIWSSLLEGRSFCFDLYQHEHGMR